MGFLEAVWHLAFLFPFDKCVENRLPVVKGPEVDMGTGPKTC